MNAFYVSGFSAFPNREFDKAAVEDFPVKKLSMNLHDIAKGIGIIPLHGFLP